MSALPPSRSVRVKLQTSPEQTERLRLLQAEFAQACNALAPLVQRTMCWNRVALHHMAYRQLRQQFPGLGSQMICNAIYSVSRTCRIVFQSKESPFSLQRLAGRPLPLLTFSPQSPVYFDRHTLSVKDGQASMYTLDGRMRFELRLGPDDDRRFRTERLREVVLQRLDDRFQLRFGFGPPEADTGVRSIRSIAAGRVDSVVQVSPGATANHGVPDYIAVEGHVGPSPTSSNSGGLPPSFPSAAAAPDIAKTHLADAQILP